MNAVPPPLLPDDEAPDPLLAGLRQRLGTYGQAPPPGAWAAIRQRLSPPPPPPLPWWRRRQLLAVLGLLLGCLLLPGKLGEWARLRQLNEYYTIDNQKYVKQFAGQVSPADASDNSLDKSALSRSAAAPAAGQVAASGSAANGLVSVASPKAGAAAALAPAAQTTAAAGARPAASRLLATKKQPAKAGVARLLSPLVRAEAAGSGRPEYWRPGVAAVSGQSGRARQPGRWSAATPAESSSPAHLATLAKRPGTRSAGATWPRHTRLLAGRARPGRVAEAATWRPASTPGLAAGSALQRPAAQNRLAWQPARPAPPEPGSSAAHPAPADAAATAVLAETRSVIMPVAGFLAPAGPLDLLALRLPGLPWPAALPPAALVARPDSTPPAPPVRRWALLVLAGPTLSYRTLGPAPALGPNLPDFARLERPALGLGAQVQVRRVLSGRWALAVGLGYHEYATRLALSLKDSAYASVHKRDTYRLLTVPVQLGYAFGVPKSRLSKALLVGFEPGWYVGGRSTEGSGCGCEQQAYSSAASSPYRSLSVAFSLGLDLRYRLGGAGSRWQWLVQPTGRYVVTPFVRADAVGFTQRQPFSLGLLTGFSWDVR